MRNGHRIPEYSSKDDLEDAADTNKAQWPGRRRIAIPKTLIGMFVGKSGAAIKGISAQANCAAHVDDAGDDGDEAMVVIGNQNDLEENIDMAVHLIQERISRLQRIQAAEQGDSAQVARHIAIPRHLVGAFVGRGGVAIKEICARAGCSAYVEDESGEDGKAIVVIGRATESPESIELGVSLVQQRVAQMHRIERKEVVKAAIPSHLVGQFVGKNGSAIKDICARAGCHAHVDDEGGPDGEAVVVVGKPTDPPETIEKGLQLVQQRIAELQDVASITMQAANGANVAGSKDDLRAEVQAEIKNMLLEAEARECPLVLADFDFKVVLFLRRLHEQRGCEGVRTVLAHLVAVTAGRTREGVRSWPAYALTLLRKFDFNARNSNAARPEPPSEAPPAPPSEAAPVPYSISDLPPQDASIGFTAPSTVASIPSPARVGIGGTTFERSFDLRSSFPGTGSIERAFDCWTLPVDGTATAPSAQHIPMPMMWSFPS